MKKAHWDKFRWGQLATLCSRRAKKNTPKTADVGHRKVRVGQRKCTKWNSHDYTNTRTNTHNVWRNYHSQKKEVTWKMTGINPKARAKDQEVDSGDFRVKSSTYIYMSVRTPGTGSVLLTLLWVSNGVMMTRYVVIVLQGSSAFHESCERGSNYTALHNNVPWSRDGSFRTDVKMT